MPEEQPLKALIPLQLILEAKLVFLVCELEQVEQLCASFHDREGRALCVVNEDWNAAIGVKA